MSGTYLPAALFGPTASIGRKQYAVAFIYQMLAAALASQMQVLAHATAGASAFVLGTIAFLVGIGAFTMMLLAIKARLSDCGMALGWLAIPLFFLVLDVVRSIARLSTSLGEGSATLLSFGGLIFVSKISVVALLVLLVLVPSAPGRKPAIGAAP